MGHRLGRTFSLSMNHFNPPAHRICTLCLVLCRLGGLADGGMDLLNRGLHGFLQLHAATQYRQPLVRQTPRQTNRRNALLGALLQRHDMRLNVTG